ncbi:hypothetical protein BLA39750_06605 [Burkholderia lata]|uniref:Uncharacterized protein n=1 Tax=Burkholderia lata (strain ATCC 17760 / DSM 23089 / LMG 22485 / NCIMB 9086 / R18194 / 383) TaxID=482957 RepID=A0A6P3B5F0_BURL3|nr:hypothetical protein BLA39750_06605 [Burkholderia lata]
MPRRSAKRVRALTVRLHRVSSGVQAGMSTLLSACVWRLRRRSPLKFTARRVGFNRGYPHRRGCIAAIGGSPSPFEYASREWICRQDRCAGARTPHIRWLALTSRIRSGREWVGRPGRHAGSRTPHIRWLALTSRIRWDRESVCRPGRHAGTWRRHNRGQVLTVEMHRIASGYIGPTSAHERTCRTIAGSHSPLKDAWLRVPATAVIHARLGLADRPREHPHR